MDLGEEPANSTARSYRDLIVWKKSVELVTEIYRMTADFPDKEKFGLVSQLRRASVSIPSNIAEGQGRRTSGEFRQFLGNARGSLHEVETQILIARNLEFATREHFEKVQNQLSEVGRLLNGLMRSLRDKQSH